MNRTTGWLPSEAEHMGSINPRKDLELNFNEPGNLSYLDTELDVFVMQVGEETTRFDVVINHPPLTGTDLVEMLGEVAPCKENAQDKDGVLGDWMVVDEAIARYRNTDEEQRLVTLHESLGGAWLDFVLSRAVLIDTLQDGKNRINTSLHNICLMPDKFEPGLDHDGGFVNELVKRQSGTFEEMVETLHDAGVENVDELVPTRLRAVILRCANVDSHDDLISDQGLKDFLAKQDPHELGSILYQLLSEFGITREQRSELARAARKKFYSTLRTEDGTEYLYLSDRFTEPLTESYARRRTITQGPYRKEVVRVTYARDGWTEDVTVPGTMEKVVEHASVSPAISWTRTQTRIGKLKRDGSYRRSFVLERFTSPTNLFERADGLLGVIAVAYLSPNVRSRWPVTMRAGDESNRYTQEQQMRAAQVPVLAQMMSSQLLSSNLIKSTESTVS